jgi:hypothetical protein
MNSTIQVSSGWTLALRLFIPTLWISFFGTLTFVTLFNSHITFGEYNVNYVKIVMVLFVLIFCAIFYFTVLKLKRVELGDDFIFITNYFTNVRYPLTDLDKLTLEKGILFNYVRVALKGEGVFGKRIVFMLSKKRMQKYLLQNPDFIEYLRNVEILKD